MSLNLKIRKPPAAIFSEEELREKFGSDPSPVIQAALAARSAYVARGGKPLSEEEINAEVAERRGGHLTADE